jgi:hypothetical protein
MARMLLGMGAKTEDVSHQGYTALLLACEGGYVAVVKLLVGWDANVNDASYGRGAIGQSWLALQPLIMAVLRGHRCVVRSIIASGRLAPSERVFGICLALAAKADAGDLCLTLASIGADLRGRIPIPLGAPIPGEWRTHAETARDAGNLRLAFRLTGEIRGPIGGYYALPCKGPPPLESQKLFWRGDSERNEYEAYCALKLEWRAHIRKCSWRARLVLLTHMLQPTAGLVLPEDTVLHVMAFVSDDVGGGWTMSAVQSAQGPQAARPMLALVACTLARQLTKEIEALPAPNSGVFGALDAHEIHIRFLEQKAAGGRCEWLLGYCAFLRAWLRREM